MANGRFVFLHGYSCVPCAVYNVSINAAIGTSVSAFSFQRFVHEALTAV